MSDREIYTSSNSLDLDIDNDSRRHALSSQNLPPYDSTQSTYPPAPRPYRTLMRTLACHGSSNLLPDPPPPLPSQSVNLASTQISRLPSRLPRRLPPWLPDGVAIPRAPSRRFASTQRNSSIRTIEGIPPEHAVIEPPDPRKIYRHIQAAPLFTTKKTKSKFHIPSVILPVEAATSGPVHKIHILGDDVRSRFIAHALCGVYDSVELLGSRPVATTKYTNFEKEQAKRTRATSEHEASRAPAPTPVDADTSPIDQLIVTGRGFEAVKALHSVKDRIDEKTSVCLLNDGMGVLEEARDTIFKDASTAPNFMLGHMSHALVYNRNRDSVKELKKGQMVLTQTDPNRSGDGLLSAEALMESLQSVKSLRMSSGSFENWMRYKLPVVAFAAAVDPVCVLLELSYQSILENKAAQSLMNQLLQEIVNVVDAMPELEGATGLRSFMHGEGLKRFCYRRMAGKASAPCDLLKRVEKGLSTDVMYQNGFFQRRARSLGVDVPVNTVMVEMIHARRAEAKAKRKSYIRVEEASFPGR